MAISVPGFEQIKEDYATNKDFGTIYKEILQGAHLKHLYFSIQDGYLFYGSHLCLPNTSIQEHVIRELHSEGCSRHLGRDKTFMLVRDSISPLESSSIGPIPIHWEGVI
eukprot:TRINITY_DN8890_c1_g2_i1.p1 TRINITY_DN8890_c1_g2~~TRINITY_DN8890_c1_g2_i1.p1  ORF type:complete len:109 (-),score=8.81 TRINITY_DN8890_c1_g2_i1:853-1179(-)